MGEEVPDRRSRRAGRLVEVDDAFLRRDEDRDSGDRLRHRRPPKLAPLVAASAQHVAGSARADRDVLRRPVGYLPQ
jgi:hypothetical protein